MSLLEPKNTSKGFLSFSIFLDSKYFLSERLAFNMASISSPFNDLARMSFLILGDDCAIDLQDAFNVLYCADR